MSKNPSLFFLLRSRAADCLLDGVPIHDVHWRYEGQVPGQWKVTSDEGDEILFENQPVDFSAGGRIKDILDGTYWLTVEVTTEVDAETWERLLGPDNTEQTLAQVEKGPQ